VGFARNRTYKICNMVSQNILTTDNLLILIFSTKSKWGLTLRDGEEQRKQEIIKTAATQMETQVDPVLPALHSPPKGVVSPSDKS
jgi:hypothetical protein